MDKTVAIVGAGITGLTLAYYLEKFGFKTILIEKADHVSGVINSVRTAGYLLENGPNTVLLTEDFKALIKELDLEDQLVLPQISSQKKFIAFTKNNNRKLFQVPQSIIQIISSKLLSPSAKLSLILEPFKQKIAADDLSVAEFIEKKFCKEISEKLFSAYLSGIWAADIKKLSARSALPKLWNLNKEFSSILFGAIAKSFKKDTAKSKTQFFSFKNGLSTITAALFSKLKKENVYLGTSLEKISINDSLKLLLKTKTSEETLTADLVILTTPLAVTKNLINLNIPEIYYAPLGIIHLAFSKESIKSKLDGFGFLVPSTEKTALLGAIFTSSVFKGRAPENQHLISCFCGGAIREKFSDPNNQTTKQRVIEELKEILDTSTNPEMIASCYYQSAIPNYHLEHYKIQEKIEHFHQSQNNIRICANWQTGISLASRLEEAKKLANEISEILNEH